MSTDPYDLHFPPDYDTEEWIWTSKGYVVIELVVRGPDPRRYSLTFRDPTRLAQDVESELANGCVFSEPNLVVVTTVDRSSIESAIEEFAGLRFRGLIPD